MLGTGIFITTGDIARVLPHPGLIVGVWGLGGLYVLAGALSYAELATMYPRAGGQYHFLKEAYGPVWGFLFGWASFVVIMTGGIAALAVGFGEYLGAFVPFFSTKNVLWSVPLGGSAWNVNGGQLAGVLVILLLTAVNCLGVREGAGLQSAVTAVKVGSIVLFGVAGLSVAAPVSPQFTAPLPAGSLLSAIGVAMIAVMWTFDGWYGATNVGEEMRRPERALPIGLIGGTLVVTALYALLNLAYVRALSLASMAETSRVGESAALALFGPAGARLVVAAVLISTFGCLSATILYAARIYLPMAQDGLFFSALARIHPRFRTPAACLVAQGAWSALLTLSGGYEQLYTYTTFAVVGSYAATGAALIVLRLRKPGLARPYRAWGYPLVPALFTLVSLAICVNTIVERPRESFAGLLLIVLGLPAYAFWRRQRAAASAAAPGLAEGAP